MRKQRGSDTWAGGEDEPPGTLWERVAACVLCSHTGRFCHKFRFFHSTEN